MYIIHSNLELFRPLFEQVDLALIGPQHFFQLPDLLVLLAEDCCFLLVLRVVLQHDHIGAVAEIAAAVEQFVHFPLQPLVLFEGIEEGLGILLLNGRRVVAGCGVVRVLPARNGLIDDFLFGLGLHHRGAECALPADIAPRLLERGLPETALQVVRDPAGAAQHLRVVGLVALKNSALLVEGVDGLPGHAGLLHQ